jgi:hypothetical protein
VSASEIGSYEYCARAYWLERVQHTVRPAAAGSRLTDGTGHHRAHGRRVAWQRRLVRAAVMLVCGAILVLVVHATRHVRHAAHAIPEFSL